MSNTKISAFPLVLNNDINQFSAIAGVGNAVGGATGVNIGMSGASLINSLEAQLNLSSFSSGTLSVVRGGTGANTFTAHGILLGNGPNAVSATTELANGELLIGSTGNAPVPATLTAGTNVTITPTAGAITIAATDTQNPFQSITGVGSGNTDSGVQLSNSGGSVLILGAGTITAAQTGNTITLTGADNSKLPAAPSTAITGTKVDGTANTFMRSDAVPALSNEITIGDISNRGLVDIEGGNSLDAQLRLNCSAGTHAVTIEGPAHSGGNNYIVKLPTGLPAVGKVLSVDTYAANGGGTSYTNPPLATMKWSTPSELVTQSLIVAASDETTDLTTGTAKSTFRMPYAFTLSAVRASVTTAPTGSTIIVNIKESGTTILSSRITIDATEKTSVTAAAQPVISDTALADDAEITVDIDQVGSTVTGTGLKITLIGTKA
tara:strand:- start:188 stop:1495 length:1308 start_codon:yes stop_codon:yes gene_type:complete